MKHIWITNLNKGLVHKLQGMKKCYPMNIANYRKLHHFLIHIFLYQSIDLPIYPSIHPPIHLSSLHLSVLINVNLRKCFVYWKALCNILGCVYPLHETFQIFLYKLTLYKINCVFEEKVRKSWKPMDTLDSVIGKHNILLKFGVTSCIRSSCTRLSVVAQNCSPCQN